MRGGYNSNIGKVLLHKFSVWKQNRLNINVNVLENLQSALGYANVVHKLPVFVSINAILRQNISKMNHIKRFAD